MRKLDKKSLNILSLLEQSKPRKLTWNEVVDSLYPKYQDKFPNSGRKGFGVAVANRLKLLEVAGSIKHEGAFYEIRMLPESQEIIMNIDKPDAHLLAVASGILSLCDFAKYRVEGMLFPNLEYRESALQHAKTGYPEIFDPVVKMAKLKELGPKCEVKKTDLNEFRKAYDKFQKEAKLLAMKLQSRTDTLRTSWCKICQSTHGKTVTDEDEAEVKKLLRIVWDAAE